MELSWAVQDTRTSNANPIGPYRKAGCTFQLGAIGGENLGCILSTVFQKGYIGRAPRSLYARGNKGQSTDTQADLSGCAKALARRYLSGTHQGGENARH